MKLYVYSLWLVAGVQSVNGKFAVTRRIMGLPTWARGVPRGGSSGVDTTIEETTTINTTEEEADFSSKVQSAMKKFGIVGVEEDSQCENGVCALPTSSVKDDKPVKSESSSASDIAKDMGVSESIAFAALAAAKGDEALAREIIEYEQSTTSTVSDNAEELKSLVEQGYDADLAKRALALTEMNVDDAKAILEAEADDEAKELAEHKLETEFKTVEVETPANFDPAAPAAPTRPATQPQGAPPPAKKEDVVFELTSENLQQVVVESPVPVLLDVYANWCGPCKALTPALEQMAIKAGGMFRLAKLNTDDERAISQLLGVEALPTVFGIRNGQITNSFRGMPQEEGLRQFMMDLMMGSDPEGLTQSDKDRYAQMSMKFAKVAGLSAFPFAVRERLQTRVTDCLNQLVEEYDGDMAGADESAQLIRQMLGKIMENPTETKYRKINMNNRVLAEKLTSFSSAHKLLKSIGFKELDNEEGKLLFGEPNKPIVNTAPLSLARSAIDKWCQTNQYKIAAAARKRRDEIARTQLAAELEAKREAGELEEEHQELSDVDENVVYIKVRIDGKNKVHDLELTGDDSLATILERVPGFKASEEIQIMCAAKRLVIKSSDDEAMAKTLRDHNLIPKASLVIKFTSADTEERSSGNLRERAAKQKKKKGAHTMQSIGVYSKDDNVKGNIVDGGGGTCYEQDVTDDEEEQPKPNPDVTP